MLIYERTSEFTSETVLCLAATLLCFSLLSIVPPNSPLPLRVTLFSLNEQQLNVTFIQVAHNWLTSVQATFDLIPNSEWSKRVELIGDLEFTEMMIKLAPIQVQRPKK